MSDKWNWKTRNEKSQGDDKWKTEIRIEKYSLDFSGFFVVIYAVNANAEWVLSNPPSPSIESVRTHIKFIPIDSTVSLYIFIYFSVGFFFTRKHKSHDNRTKKKAMHVIPTVCRSIQPGWTRTVSCNVNNTQNQSPQKWFVGFEWSGNNSVYVIQTKLNANRTTATAKLSRDTMVNERTCQSADRKQWNKFINVILSAARSVLLALGFISLFSGEEKKQHEYREKTKTHAVHVKGCVEAAANWTTEQ